MRKFPSLQSNHNMFLIWFLLFSVVSCHNPAANYIVIDISVNEIPKFLQLQICCNCSYIINKVKFGSVDSCGLIKEEGVYYLSSLKFSQFITYKDLLPYIISGLGLFSESPHGISFLWRSLSVILNFSCFVFKGIILVNISFQV